MTEESLRAAAQLDPEAAAAAWKESAVPPLELVLRTRWPGAEVDWGGADPIL